MVLLTVWTVINFYNENKGDMKTRNNLLYLLIFGFVFYQACTKEEQEVNENPVCKITSPANGAFFTIGETITISVNATDSDGDITEVQFFIDGVLKKSTSDTPFSFQWNTANEEAGQHSIKASCVDNNGAEAIDEIEIELKEEASNFGTFTDPRNGKTYVTVAVGDQTWFAENLTYDGDSSMFKNQNATSGYYSWKSAKSACPDGWHLPTDEEWKSFEMSLHMTQNDADAIGWRGEAQGMWLKSKEGWKYEGNGTDKYGFNAWPEGYLNEEGERFHYEEDALFWTATFHGSEESAWYRRLNYSSTGISRSSTSSSARFNVRCLKD